LFGLAVQQFLPRHMTTRVWLETFYDQLPHVCSTLQLEADVLLAGIAGPLPVAPELDVATDERLAARGVKGRKHADRLRAVYHMPESEAGSTSISPAMKQSSPAEAQPVLQAVRSDTAADQVAADAGEPPKAPTAQEKIALMKSARQAAPSTAPSAATSESAPASEAALGTAKKLTAAEKIALMKASKKPAAAAQGEAAAALSEVTSPAPTAASTEGALVAAKHLTAAEKIALMKASKKPAAAAPDEPVATTLESPAEKTPTASTEATAGGSKKLTAAEKIALMKAARQPAVSLANPGEPAEEIAAAPATKSLSAAEKIALMKAGRPAKSEAASSSQTEAAAGTAVAVAAPKPKSAPAAKQPQVNPEAWKRACQSLRGLYLERIRPFLGRDERRADPLAERVVLEGIFASARASLPSELHEALARLAALCEERRQLLVQAGIHRWLHAWLCWVHIPASVGLLVLGLAHAVASLYW
jgi:hypothetical protein